ncbi:hypothetical protein D3C78_1663450 [compost metagenome]
MRDFELGEQGDDDALFLGDQGREQMNGVDRRVLMGFGDGLSLLDRLLGFQGESVEAHGGLLVRGRAELGQRGCKHLTPITLVDPCQV